MEELQVEFEVAQRIGRKMLVDPDGILHIFWGEGEKQQENTITDLDTAIRQGTHVVERYQGLVGKIKGKSLILLGEAQQMSKLVGKLQDLVTRFLEPRAIKHAEEVKIRFQFEEIARQIGQVSNEFKMRARGRLITMVPLTDERGRKSTKVPVHTGEAALDLLRRFNDIGEKTWGTIIRTRLLVEEKMRIERVILSVYNSLAGFLKYFENGQVPDQSTLQSISRQLVGNKANLMAGLESIKVQPYLARIQSIPVQRLRRLPIYVEEDRTDRFCKTLKDAFLKLRPVVQERQARQLKQIIVNNNGQIKL